MTDLIRCPNCRGSKKVAKLGGMIGDCNACKGKGTIAESDRPLKVVAESLPYTHDIIKATSEAVPDTTVKDEIVIDVKHISSDAKIDAKSAVFKRKKG